MTTVKNVDCRFLCIKSGVVYLFELFVNEASYVSVFQ